MRYRPHDLHRRLQLDLPAGDELGELAATFNEMLARLEAAFDGLQRFTADAAHELRAPLAVMLADVEVSLRQPRSADEYRATIDGGFATGEALMERRLAEKRVYPALNVNRSGTRREELLLKPEVLQKVWILRKLLFGMDELEATEFLLDKLRATKNNDEFFNSMKKQ